MSTGISKKKGKRSRSRSSEVNTSFVKNVTSKVTGLLPATITKWFSSPSSTNSNGSVPPADSDSSSEDEVTEPIVTQPAAKRMRYETPGTFPQYSNSEVNCVSISPVEESATFDTTQPSTSKSNFRGQSYVSLRSAKEASVMDRKDTSLKILPSMSDTTSSMKRKSLFNNTSSNEDVIKACAKTSSNTIKDPREPSFKPSLLGSPFYSGRTMYGGAASSYINQPNIKQRKVALVNTTTNNEENSISHSAKKMLELLESYSSPLVEARRIPIFTRNTSKDTINTSLDQSSLNTSRNRSFKTQELHVPSIASILQLKKKSRLMDTTKAARQLMASHSSAVEHLTYTPVQRSRSETDSNKLTTKVKTRLTRVRGNPDMGIAAKPATELNFNAILEIDKNNLPSFSLGTPSVSKSMLTSTPRPQGAEPTTRSTDMAKTSSLFKFSSPERLPSAESLDNMSTQPFAFGSPNRSIEKLTKNVESESISSIFINTSKEAETTAIKSKDWQCPDCWVNNKPDIAKCVCCSAKQPPKASENTVKCSNCKLSDCTPPSDKCGDCFMIKNVDKPPAYKPPDSSKWKCEDCWVSNDNGVDKCLCCGGKKPTTGGMSTVQPIAVSNNDDAEWKCNVCWIKNKNDVDKCVACGDSRPGSKSASTLPLTNIFSSPFKPADQGMTQLVKSQTDKWECTSCLVRNDSDKLKCACCESLKPGSKPPEAKSFNFGMNANTSFKFGIAAASQETIKRPEDLKPKVEESETNNNILEKTPTFTFTLPTKKAKDEVDNVKDKVETPKLNFTFGVPKSVPSTTPATSSPIFGIPKKLEVPKSNPSPEDDEKPQEVPKVDFSLLADQSTVKPLGMFNTSLSNRHTTDKPLATLLGTTSAEKKEAPSNTQTLSTETSNTETLKNTFSFSAIKPSTHIFATPVSSPITTVSFSSPAQCVPIATTPSVSAKSEPSATASLTMFTNPEAKSSQSMFQKSESVTTAAITLSTPAPLFSFGTSTPSVATTAEPPKPKFNFSFGSNTAKTESPSMFNISFGESADKNVPKFSLPASNPLTNNALSGSLGSANGSITGSALPGSGLSVTNPVSSAASVAQPTGGLFGAPQKENMWSATNSTPNNFFAPNSSNNAQKPAAFTFGSTPSPFNTSTTPAFGAASPNMFGVNGTNQNLFSSPPPSQPSAPMFGSPQPNNNATVPPMYGTPGSVPVPAFGTPTPAMPTFDASSATPAAAPSFNFGAAQTAAPVFGFGQQQMSQQTPQPVYSFGAAPVAGQVQFNMGSAPNANVRRVRKAVRRTQPR